MSKQDWSTQTDLRSQLQRFWDKGELLRTRLPHAAPLFPWQLRLKKPNSLDLGNNFEHDSRPRPVIRKRLVYFSPVPVVTSHALFCSL